MALVKIKMLAGHQGIKKGDTIKVSSDDAAKLISEKKAKKVGTTKTKSDDKN